MTPDDRLYQIALTLVPHVGGVTARNLISYCGSAHDVFRTSRRQLRRIPGVGGKIADSILRSEPFLDQARKELELMERHGVSSLFWLDPEYPERLRHIHNVPVLLYKKGNPDLNVERMVGIVGTRRPTRQGIRICQQIVEGLSTHGPTIVSGLAYGIDIEAHRSAIKCQCPTIAVLGSGLGNIYPSAHMDTVRKMMASGGLVTECNFKARPDKENFPARNRIIAGLCDIIVVIESGLTGGSVITAEFANDFNRDVAAVPGRISDPMSLGTNRLIKQHKAHLIENAEDIVELMGWDSRRSGNNSVQKKIFPDLSDTERRILDIIIQDDTHVDGLARKSGMAMSELAAVLLSLECRGIVQSIPGKRYQALTPVG